LSWYMFGVALRKPSSVPTSRTVRLQVVSTTATNADVAREPNWTCAKTPKTTALTLQATAAFPEQLDAANDWYVAVTFRSSTARNIRRNTKRLFGTNQISECYKLDATTRSAYIPVKSHAAVYTRIVQGGAGEGCPLP